MYEIAAFVADRRILERHFRDIDLTYIVDLDLEPFALIPVARKFENSIREKSKTDLYDMSFTDDRYTEGIKAIVRDFVVSPDAVVFAFVGAAYFGGSGMGYGCAFDSGTIRVFNSLGAKWPNSNISMALKSIGVPERLDDRLDAFDVLGLGRCRRAERWLDKPPV